MKSDTTFTRMQPQVQSFKGYDKRYLKTNPIICPTKKHIRKNFFPYKLMQMLSSPSFADCVVWAKDGSAFYFVDRDKFIEKITKNTKSEKYQGKSFTRKLNRWGFRMSWKKGPKYGMYSHKLFQRDKPWLCENMVCEKNDDDSELKSSHQIKPVESFESNYRPSSEQVSCLECGPIGQPIEEQRISGDSNLNSENNMVPSTQMMQDRLQEIDHKILLVEYLILKKIQSMKSNAVFNEIQYNAAQLHYQR